MRIASIVLLCVSAVLILAGLVPCVGWLNWIGVPCAAATAIVGIVGISQSNAPERDRPVHMAALIGGALFMLIGAVRCILGGFLV